MAIFFLQPIAFGAWLPRIPDIQARLAIGPGDLAIALIGMPVGILVMLPFAGRLVARIGSRQAILYGFWIFLGLVFVPALSGSVGMLFATLMLLGAAMTTMELSLNVEADQIEKMCGRLIMNRCHGFWSLGIMAGSLIGGALASLGLGPAPAVFAVAIVVLPAGLFVGVRLPKAETADDAVAVVRLPFKLPSAALLAICLFTFGITMTEGAVADWSAVYLRDLFATNGILTGLGYTLFALVAAGGRFVGDLLKARLGAVMLARICGVFALIGMLVVVIAPVLPVAYLGFVIVGFGVSVGFPLAVSASAALTDRPAAASVAILSFIALLGFLVGPPVIGFAAKAFGLKTGLAMLLPALAISLLLTGALTTHESRQPEPEPA
ncbi:MFS transporter [Rhizobium halophytocola]|uniref:MFS family permease n=1 Tax=Rhizobium halophytocola TaxID=735519 RepID=A0ABS4DZA2_9HYPH|nr:MFS family permease [Rhizobium halophytocola]